MVVSWLKNSGSTQLQAGLEQLGADQQRQHAADQEHREAEPQVHRADVLVVGGGDPAHDPGRVVRVVVPCSCGRERDQERVLLPWCVLRNGLFARRLDFGRRTASPVLLVQRCACR
jgi:hypothetical protein